VAAILDGSKTMTTGLLAEYERIVARNGRYYPKTGQLQALPGGAVIHWS
jgi:hypothetical protein